MPWALKQELIEKILATEDENLLLLIKAGHDYFTQENTVDVTDELSQDDKDELHNMANEPFGKDTVTQQEFDEAIRQRHTE